MNILEAILPKLQEIVEVENKKNGCTLVCKYEGGFRGPIIRIQHAEYMFSYGGLVYWLDIAESKIEFYYSGGADRPGLQYKEEEWTDPDLIHKLTNHIKVMANNEQTKAHKNVNKIQ